MTLIADNSRPKRSLVVTARVPNSPLRPNLFVIGASKAGTSALHAYLSLHPMIRMSDEKEPCFFVDQSELEVAWPVMARNPVSHDWNAYLRLFEGGESACYRGEASVYYSQSPHRSGVPRRIADVSPDARLIYLVREPVTRAIGHYWQRAKEFQEMLPLERAIQENSIYRDTSDYAMQLDYYLDVFPRNRIRIVVAEELRANRREVLSSLLNWLELPAHDYDDQDLRERHQSRSTSRRQRFPFVKLIRDSSIWAAARQRLPASAVERMRRLSTVEFNKAEVSDRIAREWLADYFRPRRKAFSEALGREVELWST